MSDDVLPMRHKGRPRLGPLVGPVPMAKEISSYEYTRVQIMVIGKWLLVIGTNA